MLWLKGRVVGGVDFNRLSFILVNTRLPTSAVLRLRVVVELVVEVGGEVPQRAERRQLSLQLLVLHLRSKLRRREWPSLTLLRKAGDAAVADEAVAERSPLGGHHGAAADAGSPGCAWRPPQIRICAITLLLAL